MNSFLGRNDDSCALAMLRRGPVLKGMLEGVWAEIGNWFDHRVLGVCLRAAIALSALNERAGAGYALLLNDLATKAAITRSHTA